MFTQPMKIQVGDKLYEEGIDFLFTKNREVIMTNAQAKPKKWWQFWKAKVKPMPFPSGNKLPA